MENKKIAAIALIIAIALSAVGLIYAHWSDTATIHGNIQMGTLDLAFYDYEEPSAADYHLNPNYPPGAKWLTGEAEGKDVGSAIAYFEDYYVDPHSGKDGYKTLVINITNAYPQYAVHTTFWVHNIGTVPLYIYDVSLIGQKKTSAGTVQCDLVMTTWINTTTWTIEGAIYEDWDGSGTVTLGDTLVMNFLLKNDEFPYQLDPCHSDKMEMDLDFKQEAEQCHKYTLTFQILAVQWNKVSEVPVPPQLP
jgi:hypothetical protein